MKIEKIALGGGCHWCTEAVFQSLKGVQSVAQGWVASTNKNTSFSEAVVIEFIEEEIPLAVLLEIHLRTHKSTSNHSMRKKYRSAIYYFNATNKVYIKTMLSTLQAKFNEKIITQIIPFHQFKPSDVQFQNYYAKNPTKPFCEKYINPKLQFLLNDFSKYTKPSTSI